ncbi:glycosyl transferase family 1, partial [Staphylococcus arlettae]|nr:glycosyl transferase family 1 [Staphylococcus arlettae]
MIYTVTSILPPIHGGRTKSLLERSKFLDQALNIPTTILTTNYNANYNDVYSKFLEEGKVTENIRYDNIYDWLADYKLLTCSEHNDGTPPTFIETPVNIEGLSHEVIKSKHIVRYYSSDNTYVLYRKFKADTNILEFEDFMSP